MTSDGVYFGTPSSCAHVTLLALFKRRTKEDPPSVECLVVVNAAIKLSEVCFLE